MTAELPPGWARACLASVGVWGSGGTPSRGDAKAYGGAIPWLKIGDLPDGLVFSAEERITEHGLAVSSAKLVPPSTLLVAMYGSIGKLGITTESCATNQAIAFCKPYVGFELRYLFYLLMSDRHRLIDQGQGGAQLNISQTILKAHEVAIAPHFEQKRIVSKIEELFSCIDEGERALERVQKLVERYRQSVLKSAITGELTREWREKNKDKLETGEALLTRILKARRDAWEKAELAKMKAKGITPVNDKWKQEYEEPVSPDTSGLPILPEGWTWASLAQLAWASSYGTSQKCDAAASGVAVLRIPNIRAGAFNYEDIKSATADLRLDASDALAPGDLLVIRTNGSESLIGVGATLLAETPFPCYFASYLIRFRLVLPSSLSEWVNFCWQSRVVRQFIHEHKATSAGQYNVSQSSLMTLCLPIPPVDEISEVVDELKRSFSKSENAATSVSAQLRHTTALRQGVLKSAFSGLLVSQDPADEPATALLERIAVVRGADNAAPKRGRKKKTAA